MIKTENLTHLYSPKTPFEMVSLDNVNIEIKKGEYIGLIGHTGSGKSTLLQHFNGLLKPTSGKVYVDGEDIWEKPKEIGKIRCKVGMVFQYPEHQLFEESVYKDIAFGPANMGLSEEEIKQRVFEAMDFVGLEHEMAIKSPFEISGGQKRKAAIAGVISMKSDILILDEPTAGLDPGSRREILEKINEYHKTRNATIILVSHSMEDVAEFADRILVMNQGGVYMFDTVKEVFRRAGELKEIGLDIPQVTQIFSDLKKRGTPLGDGVYTVDGAKREIMRALEQKRGEGRC